MARAKGIGVDGCPAGWVMATVMNGAAEPVEVYASISELYAAAKSKASVILLDMPIGLSEGNVGMGFQNDFGRFGRPGEGAAPGPINFDVLEKVSGCSGLAASVLVQRDVDLSLETPCFVPVCLPVTHEDEPGALALGRKR